MTPEREEWLSGFYPSKMENWEEWKKEWSMGPNAKKDWVWFSGYFTEQSARKVLEKRRNP
jgi:hypothetical protein